MKTNLPTLDVEVEVPANEYLVSETDLKGRITYANPAFVKTSCYPLEALLGSSHNLVRHPDMPRVVFAELWQTLKNGRPWQGLIKNRCKDGRYYWVNATIVPITVNQEHIGYMSVRKRASDAEKQAAETRYAALRAGHRDTPKRRPATPKALLKQLIAFFMFWILLGAGVGLHSMQTGHAALAEMHAQLQQNQRIAEGEIRRLDPTSSAPQQLARNSQLAGAIQQAENERYRLSLILTLAGLLGGGILFFLLSRNFRKQLFTPIEIAARECERISQGNLVKPVDIVPDSISRKISEGLAIMQTHLMVMIDEMRHGILATKAECHALNDASQKNVINAEEQHLHLSSTRELLGEIAGSFINTSNQAEALLESFLNPEQNTSDKPAKDPAQVEHEFRELVTATRLSAFIIEDCLQQLNDINDLMVDSREASHAMHRSAQSLNIMATTLSNLISRFKTFENSDQENPPPL